MTSTSYISSEENALNPSIENSDNALFHAAMDDVTSMSKILQEMHHQGDHSNFVISKDGIRLVSTGEKAFQVSAFFSASTFQKYKFDGKGDEKTVFRFLMKDFIESINILRDDMLVEGDRTMPPDENLSHDKSTTSLIIRLRKKGDILRLRLMNKSNYVINCELKAFNGAGDSIFNPLIFSDGEETAVILFNSKRLFEYVSGMDLTSSDQVHLVMAPGEVPFKLTTRSVALGEVELEITSNETEIIKREIVVSDNCMFSFSYKTQFMKPALEAMKTSLLTQMRCGSSGLLCIEHFHSLERPTRDGPFLRPEANYTSTQANVSVVASGHQATDKKSSVEYFILCEAKAIDACPD